jgi:hypothetical protein
MSASVVKVVGRAERRRDTGRARSGSWWVWVLALETIVVLLLAVTVAATLLAERSRVPGEGSGQAGPDLIRAGLPVGFAHSEEGAEAMAARFSLVSFAVLDGRLSAPPATIAHVYATPSYDATLTALLEQTAAQRSARAARWGEVRYRRAVLGTRIISYTGSQATVDTWDLVVASEARAPTVSDQFVEEWHLEWFEGDWKLAGAPTSEPARMSQAELGEVLETYNGRGDGTPGY